MIRDCSEDGVLNGKYSQSELDGALEQLPSDLDEYTDCRSVIRRAQLGSAGNKRRARAQAFAAERVDAASPPDGSEQQEIDKAAGSGGRCASADRACARGGRQRRSTPPASAATCRRSC